MTAIFDDVQLPVDVEVGAKGGPNFKTTVTDFSNGNEQRNQDWQEHRVTFDVGYGISDIDDLSAVKAFFYARRGRARCFRFKDWSDYVLEQEPIAIGDGATTAFQIIKTYEASGPHPYGRRITRPVADTLIAAINGVETTAFTLGALGIITFTSAPANDAVITISCEFDVPMRFDTDKFEISMEAFEAGVVPSLPVIEVRE